MGSTLRPKGHWVSYEGVQGVRECQGAWPTILHYNGASTGFSFVLSRGYNGTRARVGLFSALKTATIVALL